MLVAQLRGKLSSEVWLGSEDLLTSSVFGSLKNLSPSIASDLLRGARPLAGSSPPVPQPPFSWLFWPWWQNCEPDVVIEDQKNVYLIEAKLYSDFGQDAGAGSQLRREWTEGKRYSRQAGKEFWLIAVTNHASAPAAQIRRQLAHASADLSHVCWFSWPDVGRLVRSVQSEECRGWCEDLLELLIRMGLAPFDGLADITGISRSLAARLPLIDKAMFGIEAQVPVGFRAVLETASSFRPFPAKPWPFPRLAAIQDPEFAKSLEAARTYLRKGGMLWRPNLN